MPLLNPPGSRYTPAVEPVRNVPARQKAGLPLAIPVLIGVGWAIVQPWGLSFALIGGGVALMIGLLVIRPGATWWTVFSLSFGGAIVLGYGFANLGILTPLAPLPLAEASLLLLGTGVLLSSHRAKMPSAVFVPLSLFLIYGVIRLVWDFPRWGLDAVRDFTTPLELLFLFVGIWGMSRFGLDRWIRTLSWVFLLAVAYFLLYPLREQLVALSPVVGLQQPVTLIGQYAGAGPAAASGMFFFALLRPSRWSYLFAALFAGLMLLFQGRAFYIAVPLAAAIVVLLSRSRGPGSPRRRLGLALLLVVGVGTAVLALGPPGRLGAASPEFFASQARTLLGEPGPGAGSLRHRLKLYESVRAKMRDEPYGWLVGVGLGPDLTVGFEEGEVRKPHNDFLEIFARMGLLGLVPFVWLLAVCFWRAVRAARSTSGVESRFLWWVVATAVVYLFVAAVQPLLAFPYGTIPLFSLLGAALALVKTQRPSQTFVGRHLVKTARS